jgi:two-component system, OmpR family, sensor histidine kinase MprB
VSGTVATPAIEDREHGGIRMATTFRGRLVIAVTAAVVVAVVLASVAAYLVAHDSLVGSIDVTLDNQAQALVDGQTIPNTCSTTAGVCVQVVYLGGTTNPADPTVLAVPAQAKAAAASQGTAAPTYISTVASNTDVREVILALRPGYVYRGNNGTWQLNGGGALQLTSPLTGVNQELRHLAVALWIIAILGVVLAVLLGLAVGRTALGPLDSLTETVEELAETTDVSRRLDPGGQDELGRLRRAFNRLLEALDTSRESQRQLVLDASHELRTPLTSLRTNMEVARRMDELALSEREVLIGDVLTQLDELTTVVADLAELARGEVPHRAPEPVRLDLVVHDTVAVATTHGRSRGVTLRTTAMPTWVSGSRARIERAVGNLVDNAIKWSPDGSSVEVMCARGTVVVRDHGPGISDADIDHIFDRFYRAPSARGLPGSGLGLAIVAQVAREEGGTVEAHHAEGGGALFRFSLPEITPPPAADGGPAAEP